MKIKCGICGKKTKYNIFRIGKYPCEHCGENPIKPFSGKVKFWQAMSFLLTYALWRVAHDSMLISFSGKAYWIGIVASVVVWIIVLGTINSIILSVCARSYDKKNKTDKKNT
ncbi:MAG: hypothetical protein IJC78_01025 [Clostridia bacterium]|nr:hypothetical protein [Clostridia bacterium]